MIAYFRKLKKKKKKLLGRKKEKEMVLPFFGNFFLWGILKVETIQLLLWGLADNPAAPCLDNNAINSHFDFGELQME